jgi:phosphopantothenoylcysteine synthetase/decarboxylase
MKILISSGGTREPIDGVRVIANHSTGHTGAQLADAFTYAGDTVTLLCAVGAVRPLNDHIEQLTFVTVADLDAGCAQLLSERDFDLMIHSAAVSDFVVDAVVVNRKRYPAPLTHKLDSTQSLSVELKPGKKILSHLKSYSKNPAMKLVGFKLTDGANEEEMRMSVEKLFDAGADLVVHNDVQQMHALRATIWSPLAERVKLNTMADLASYLIQYSKN